MAPNERVNLFRCQGKWLIRLKKKQAHPSTTFYPERSPMPKGLPKILRTCEHCNQEFQPLNNKQRFCQAPDCREAQREATNEYRRQWWRDYRAGMPSQKELRQSYCKTKKCCFLCGKPLRKGERINHIPCIEKRAYRRIDGNYLYV